MSEVIMPQDALLSLSSRYIPTYLTLWRQY